MGIIASGIRRFLPHILIGAFVLLGILTPSLTIGAVQAAATWFLRVFDWLTLLVASGALIFCAGLAFSPIGDTRIGGEKARPEFRTVTWLAMLFAAGMGAGLVVWGAAEPLIHTLVPPPGVGEAGSDAARREALAITQFHWSVHAWSIYAVAALAVAVGAIKGSAILPSTPFQGAPTPVRRTIDWVTLIAVIFGLVASLGQGAFQMGSGVSELSQTLGLAKIQLGDGLGTQMAILVLLTVAFMTSAAMGLRKGIAVLSNLNMVLSLMLAAFILVVGPTGAIFHTFWESLLAYGEAFWRLSTDIRPEGEGRAWTRGWSLTYFLWWVAWAPFVGVFVARISRGRRIREFILGVVLVPSFVTLVWFSILGGAALHFDSAGIDLGVTDFATAQSATYVVLAELPLAALSQLLTLLLVFVFLLTSADSGAYVLAMFSSAKPDPEIAERLYWGGVLAVLTGAALLSEGGQSVTRAFAVTGAIPLTLLLVVQAGAVLRHHLKA